MSKDKHKTPDEALVFQRIILAIGIIWIVLFVLGTAMLLGGIPGALIGLLLWALGAVPGSVGAIIGGGAATGIVIALFLEGIMIWKGEGKKRQPDCARRDP